MQAGIIYQSITKNNLNNSSYIKAKDMVSIFNQMNYIEFDQNFVLAQCAKMVTKYNTKVNSFLNTLAKEKVGNSLFVKSLEKDFMEIKNLNSDIAKCSKVLPKDFEIFVEDFKAAHDFIFENSHFIGNEAKIYIDEKINAENFISQVGDLYSKGNQVIENINKADTNINNMVNDSQAKYEICEILFDKEQNKLTREMPLIEA